MFIRIYTVNKIINGNVLNNKSNGLTKLYFEQERFIEKYKIKENKDKLSVKATYLTIKGTVKQKVTNIQANILLDRNMSKKWKGTL